jgi:neutral amino acid transport system permease protein
VSPTTVPARRAVPWLAALLGVLLTAAMVFLAAPAAHAAPGDDQEKTDFYFAGVITNEDKPVADVTMTIKGNGFEADTKTDAEGKWRLYVPEKGDYVLTVDEETLPKGVIVDAAQLPEGIAPIQGTTASFAVTFGLTDTKIINLFLGEGERVTTSFFDQFVERLMNGLNFGLLLALAAIGVSLIYGTTGLSNFAHGEMLTFGAIIALIFGTWLAIPMWITIPIVIVAGAALGWSLDAGLWRPLRRKGLGLVQLMIVSIGLSLALRYTYQFFIGGGTYQLPDAGVGRDIKFGPIALSWIDVVSMVTSIVLLIGVAYWLLRTRIGKATRAISDNPGLAAASGINVDRVIRIVWILSAVLAAVAGVLWAYFRPGVKLDMGGQVLLLIFAAVTLGGLGTAFGALVGSLIVGLLVEVSTLWIPSDMKYVGALALLIIILLVRPQGILGRKERLG